MAAVLLIGPSEIRANIGPRWWGDLAADPQGLKDVEIVHETLAIDLRPLAALQPAHVEAVYELKNPGREKKFDLLFVSGAPDVSDFEVRLDGRVLVKDVMPPKDSQEGTDLPVAWQAPYTLPGIDGMVDYYLFDPFRRTAPQPFSVTLPSGLSIIAVSYRARACGSAEAHPTTTWLFPYMLAPARSWGKFGTLETTVYVPAGWVAGSALALSRPILRYQTCAAF